MNNPGASPNSSLNPASTNTGRDYALTDELARSCLPRELKDSYRTLAWVNSICALFILVGMVGLRAPGVIVKVKPLSALSESAPVVFIPPPAPPKPFTEQVESENVTDAPVDTLEVVSVVAGTDAADVAFAVPVQGAVVLAPTARFAPPAPAETSPTAAPAKFTPATANDGGSYPAPAYPGAALRNRYQGAVQIYIAVDSQGKVTEAKVHKSSGFPALDEAALDVVKNRWQFPPGGTRLLIWPCVFQLQ